MSTLAPQRPAPPASATPLAYPPADSPPAFLLIDHNGTRQAGPILGRVLIGRRAANHIVIPDPAIARIHAWIIRNGIGHILCDTASPIGTLVNNRRITGRHALQDGDAIAIGPATIHYHTDPASIAGAASLDLSDRPLATTRPEDGQFVDCACGAPLWVPWNFAGKMGQCRYCNQTIIIQTKLAVVAVPGPTSPRATPPAYSPADSPRPPRATPPAYPPADSPRPSPAVQAVCGICQSPIHQHESQHACPACAIPFHADCWTENHGCSSYGCPQVNILDTPQSPPLGGGESEEPPPQQAPPLPWEFLILAAAVLGSIAGAWTFGIPPLAAAVAALIALRKRPHHRAALYVALPFAALGCIAGIAISYFWWLTGRHHR